MARLIRVTADPPWGWCGGLRHPPQAEYPEGALTEAQLRAMLADPSLTVEEIYEGGPQVRLGMVDASVVLSGGLVSEGQLGLIEATKVTSDAVPLADEAAARAAAAVPSKPSRRTKAAS